MTRPNDDRPSPSDWPRLHLWQIQPIRDVLVLLSIAGLVYVGYLASVVTVPLLLGLLLAYLFEPVVARLAKRIGRTAASGATVAVAMLVILVPLLVGGGVAIAQGAQFLGNIERNWPRIRTEIEDISSRSEEQGLLRVLLGLERERPASEHDADAQPTDSDPPPQDMPEEADADTGAPQNGDNTASADDEPADWLDRVQPWLRANREAIASGLAGGGGAVLHALSTIGYLAFTLFFLTPLFFFFCSVGFGPLRELGASLIPAHEREPAINIIRKMDAAISAFVRGRIVIGLILGVILTIGWWIVGVPAPVLIGLITGVLGIVPYLALIGWVIATVALIVSQVGSGDPMAWWLMLLLPSIVYWGAQVADDYLLTPLIQGKSTGLSTPMILVAVLGGAAVAGIYGVLLAIPVAACLKILALEVFWPRYRKWVEGTARDPLPIGSSRDDP